MVKRPHICTNSAPTNHAHDLGYDLLLHSLRRRLELIAPILQYICVDPGEVVLRIQQAQLRTNFVWCQQTNTHPLSSNIPGYDCSCLFPSTSKICAFPSQLLGALRGFLCLELRVHSGRFRLLDFAVELGQLRVKTGEPFLQGFCVWP